MTQYNLQGLQDPTGMRRTDLSSTASDDATAAALLRGVPIPTVNDFAEGTGIDISVSGPQVTITVDPAEIASGLESEGFPKVDDITVLSPITRAFTAPNKIELDFNEAAALTLSNASNVFTGNGAAITPLKATAEDAITKRHTQNTDTGTNSNTFTLGNATDADVDDINLVFGDANNKSIRKLAGGGWMFNAGVEISASGLVVTSGGADITGNSSVVGTFNSTSNLSEISKRVVVPDRVTVSGAGMTATPNNTNGTVVLANTATLDTVTDNGATTTNAISVGDISAGNVDLGAGAIVLNGGTASATFGAGISAGGGSFSVDDVGNAVAASIIINGGTQISGHLSATATLNFDLTAVTVQDLTMTVTGAALGDAVCIGVPHGSVTTSVQYTGWVSASDTVTIRARTSAAGENPASGTFRADVWKH